MQELLSKFKLLNEILSKKDRPAYCETAKKSYFYNLAHKKIKVSFVMGYKDNEA